MWIHLGYITIFGSIFVATILHVVDGACTYEQIIYLGEEYFIYNDEYPGNYSRGTFCTWQATSEPGTRLVLNCNDIDIPFSTNCQYDKLTISLTGSSNFADGRNFCGSGTLTQVSEDNRLSVALSSVWYSPFIQGGRFACSISAIPKPEPTTTKKPPVRCDCGWRQGMRITGGTETGINEFPFMGGIIDSQRAEIFCGATIISERYALSAAHCFLERPLFETGLVVGEHNVTSGTDTSYASIHRLEDVIIHPEYNSRVQQNDIAIIKTYESIKFSMYVGPVCLPFRYTSLDFVDATVTALGWGAEEFSGPRSDVLQKVDLKVVGNAQCKLTEKTLTSKQLCTYAPGKDTCQSDSGGPIIWNAPVRRFELVGIISFGLGCGTQIPSVNTRITEYLNWIVSQTPDADYCVK